MAVDKSASPIEQFLEFRIQTLHFLLPSSLRTSGHDTYFLKSQKETLAHVLAYRIDRDYERS